jgi:acetyltransferase-like isoleucine patch superfamily enzyme
VNPATLLDMPWRIRLHAGRILAIPYIRLLFILSGVQWGRRWRIFGAPIIQRHRGSTILCGDGLELRSWPSSNPLSPVHPVFFATRTHDAEIVIGDDCGFTGTTIVSASSIRIGSRVMIGANSTIADTDFHPLDPRERLDRPDAGRHAPIRIDDDVFVGMSCLILKGVHIGRGAVVGAGSVVVKDVPPNAIVAGNPARVVGSTAGGK